MVRKQVYIEPWQEEGLKRRSRELGITEAELIRRGIESALAAEADQQAARLKAWRKVVSFMEELSKLDVPQTGRDWTREDAYGERLSRFPDRH